MDFAEVPCKTKEARITLLMERYGAQIKRLCYLYLKDFSLAEDAASETFLKAYRALDRFREDSSEKTWLTRIAVNTCKDQLRSFWLRRMGKSLSLHQLNELSVDPVFPDDTVIRAIMALPRKHREVILLRYYQEMDIKDIALALSVPQGTVKSRLNRAKEKLYHTLERWYFDEE